MVYKLLYLILEIEFVLISYILSMVTSKPMLHAAWMSIVWCLSTISAIHNFRENILESSRNNNAHVSALSLLHKFRENILESLRNNSAHISALSLLHKFRENILESSRNNGAHISALSLFLFSLSLYIYMHISSCTHAYIPCMHIFVLILLLWHREMTSNRKEMGCLPLVSPWYESGWHIRGPFY